MTDNIGIAEFFAETLDLCRECLGQVLAYVGLLTIFSLAIDLALREPENLSEFAPFELTAGGIAISIAYLLVLIVLSYVLVVAMLMRRGEQPEFGRRLLPYVGLTVVSGIGIVVGLVLFVIPGLIVLTRWTAAPGYAVARDTGIVDSMRASWDLTQGKGWHIFGGLAVIVFGGGLLSGVLDGTLLGVSGRDGIAVTALSLLISNASGALSTAFGIAVFCQLDRNAGRTADVFT